MKRGSGRAERNNVAGLQLLPRDGGETRAFAVLNGPVDRLDEIFAAGADDLRVLLSEVRIAEEADVGRV